MVTKKEEIDMLNPTNLTNLNGNQQNQMKQQFDNFAKTVNGNPEAIVNNLISSGQMSQQQYQQLSIIANALRNVLK